MHFPFDLGHFLCTVMGVKVPLETNKDLVPGEESKVKAGNLVRFWSFERNGSNENVSVALLEKEKFVTKKAWRKKTKKDTKKQSKYKGREKKKDEKFKGKN